MNGLRLAFLLLSIAANIVFSPNQVAASKANSADTNRNINLFDVALKKQTACKVHASELACESGHSPAKTSYSKLTDAEIVWARHKLTFKVQNLLNQLLYYSGPVSGEFDPSSAKALASFLRDERSDLDPKPSEDVLALLLVAQKRIAHSSCPRAKSMSEEHTVACMTLSD